MTRSKVVAFCVQSAVISGFIAVIVPIQTFLWNREMFLFSMNELLLEACVAFLVLFVGSCAFMIVVEHVFGHFAGIILRLFFLSITICLYLETGLLSIGLPSLNGTSSFSNIVTKGYDSFVWILIVCIVFCCHRFFVKWSTWIEMGLFLLMFASIFDSKRNSENGNNNTNEFSKDFYPLYDVVKNVQCSRSSNVLIFVLDSFPATAASIILNRVPELKNKFPGFTAFPGNLGMHDETATGLPALLTGRYCSEHDDRGAFGMSIYGDESFLVPYVRANCPVFFSEGLHQFGYTNRLRELYTTETVTLNKTGLAFLRSTGSTPYFRLIDIVFIRLVPYVFKNQMLNMAIKAVARIPPPASAARETFTYKALADAGFSDESKKMLGFFHTVGTHPPFLYDKSGNSLNPARTDRDGLLDIGLYKLRLLGELFDALRNKGVYDISTIIVAADHGCVLMRENDSQGYESSILWIKPKGCIDSFSSNQAPTSNSKVSLVVKELLNRDLSIEDMKKMLVQEERIVREGFYGVTKASLGLGKVHYTDWVYGADGKLLRKERH